MCDIFHNETNSKRKSEVLLSLYQMDFVGRKSTTAPSEVKQLWDVCMYVCMWQVDQCFWPSNPKGGGRGRRGVDGGGRNKGTPSTPLVKGDDGLLQAPQGGMPPHQARLRLLRLEGPSSYYYYSNGSMKAGVLGFSEL